MFESMRSSWGHDTQAGVAQVEFFQEHGLCDLVTVDASYNIRDMSLLDFTLFIKNEMIPNGQVVGYSNRGTVIRTAKSDPNPIFITLYRSYGRADKLAKTDVDVTVVASPVTVADIMGRLDHRYHNRSMAEVHWWYMTRNGPSSINVALESTNEIKDEYYPYLEGGPDEYFQKFLDSSCPILLMSGAPGTGKTSFLRHALSRYHLNCYIAYDMALFKSDVMFINFMTNQDAHVMVFEDAENLLLPRTDGNEDNIMSRFLNVSDGLVKFPQKKFIFTTNDSDFNNVDEALIRPGRCFGSKHFRTLAFDEAVCAAKVAGVQVPEERRDYSLAELFNGPKIGLRKIGF
jgi:hypothetical protein